MAVRRNRARHDQRGICRHGQADLIQEHVRADDQQSVLRDQGYELLSHTRTYPNRAAFDIGQERGGHAEQRQECAKPVHEFDAVPVGHRAQHGSADAAHAERKTEE